MAQCSFDILKAADRPESRPLIEVNRTLLAQRGVDRVRISEVRTRVGIEIHYLSRVSVTLNRRSGPIRRLTPSNEASTLNTLISLELTHAWPALLPVVIASISSYAVSVLALERSILTEKIARRGLHLTSDYTTDPPETFFVKDVVRQGLPPVPVVGEVTTEATLRHAANVFAETGAGPLRVRGRDGETLGHILIQDILVARLHDLTEATDRSRYLNNPHPQ